MNIGYCRVSTDEQARNGYSLDFQETELRKKFTQMGITDYRIMVDDGVSAKNMNRPNMNKINDYIKEGDVEILLVYKLDRLTRNLSDLIIFLDACTLHEVAFISIAESLDINSAMGRLFVYFIGTLAQFEREQISERTITGLIAKANKGEFPHRSSPYGFIKDEKEHLHQNPAQVKVIRHIYQLYALEFESESVVLEYAKQSNLKIHKEIYTFLSRYIYRGYVEIPSKSGNLIEICEPVFSQEEFEIIKARRYQNRKRGTKKYEYKYFNKVMINGRPARHCKVKKKNNREYNYYFIKGVGYVNEIEIDQFLMKLHKTKEYSRKEQLENLLKDYSKALLNGNMTKDEFDKKYEEVSQLHLDEVKFKFINVIIKGKVKYFEIVEV